MRTIRRCGLLAAFGAASLYQSIAFPDAAQAGFFDFLFGAPPSSAPAVRPYEAYPGQMSPYWGGGSRFRRHAHRPAGQRVRKAAAVRTGAGESGLPVRPQGPVDLMDDDSLRKGDAVMTPSGIRIFVGYSGTRHAPDDFRKPSEIKRLSKLERKALAAIDALGSPGDGKAGMAAGRSAADPNVSTGKTITDPRGRTIRYVGP